MVKKVPIAYAYVYAKLRKKILGDIVRANDLKEEIYRHLCWNKKSPFGLPRNLIHEILKDFEYWCLVTKLNQTKYQILKNSCENKVKKFMWN